MAIFSFYTPVAIFTSEKETVCNGYENLHSHLFSLQKRLADNKWKSWNKRQFQLLQNKALMKTNRNLLYDSANVISAQPCSPNSTCNTSRPLTTSMYEASASRVVASLSPLTRSLLGSTGIFLAGFLMVTCNSEPSRVRTPFFRTPWAPFE